MYPEDDEVDDFNVVFEYDDELSITCSDVGYAIDGPHACVNITFDNRTCILTADCLDDANSTYYTNTCDLKCCEVDESYRLPGNWTVYDNQNGILTCRSDLLECAINVLPEEGGGTPSSCRDGANDDAGAALVPTDDAPLGPNADDGGVDDNTPAGAPVDDSPGAPDDDGHPPADDAAAGRRGRRRRRAAGRERRRAGHSGSSANHRCDDTSECDIGYECATNGVCESSPAETKACESTSDCVPGYRCDAGTCAVVDGTDGAAAGAAAAGRHAGRRRRRRRPPPAAPATTRPPPAAPATTRPPRSPATMRPPRTTRPPRPRPTTGRTGIPSRRGLPTSCPGTTSGAPHMHHDPTWASFFSDRRTAPRASRTGAKAPREPAVR